MIHPVAVVTNSAAGGGGGGGGGGTPSDATASITPTQISQPAGSLTVHFNVSGTSVVSLRWKKNTGVWHDVAALTASTSFTVSVNSDDTYHLDALDGSGAVLKSDSQEYLGPTSGS